MGLTALQLVQSACYETNSPSPPTALVGGTDAQVLQLLNLFYATGRELRAAASWPQLKRLHFVILEPGRSQYPLPQDFYAAVPGTHWDRQNQWDMLGPLTDLEWTYRNNGYVPLENRFAYRVFGPDVHISDARGQFHVSPVPGDGSAGQLITFEYISKSWLLPPPWAASTAVTGTIYRHASGNIYKLTTNGTTSTTAPTMAEGIGQNGGVWWLYRPYDQWLTVTSYNAGEYVTNNGNIYLCVQSGFSSSSNPDQPVTTDPDTDYEEGTVTWRYITAPAWTAETEYALGDHVIALAGLFKAVTPTNVSNGTARSGKIEPRWNATTETDNTAVWTAQPQAYDQLQTDSDLCLFDDELVIAGLKWRFLRARGAQYQDMQAEYEFLKNKAASRFSRGQVLRMGDSGGLRVNIPEGNFGV